MRLYPGQKRQHGIAPELPVHAQRSTTGKPAGQKIVVAEAVRMRALGFGHRRQTEQAGQGRRQGLAQA